jgi:hypothetical protein
MAALAECWGEAAEGWMNRRGPLGGRVVCCAGCIMVQAPLAVTMCCPDDESVCHPRTEGTQE